jgi:hypothetical protein
MKYLLFLLISICIITSINAQDINDVKKNENKFVYGKSIKLFLGDKIYVTANLTDNSLKDFKITNTVSDSSKTVIIEFKYDDFGNHKATILKISNPFKHRLSYKAKIKRFSQINYVETSIEPVFPKIFSMEAWPFEIESIILTDFKLNN